MSSIKNLSTNADQQSAEAANALRERIRGSKFRPVDWSDISKPGCPVLGWGIEEKVQLARRYIPRALDGKIHPFASKKEAQIQCDELNAIAGVPA